WEIQISHKPSAARGSDFYTPTSRLGKKAAIIWRNGFTLGIHKESFWHSLAAMLCSQTTLTPIQEKMSLHTSSPLSPLAIAPPPGADQFTVSLGSVRNPLLILTHCHPHPSTSTLTGRHMTPLTQIPHPWIFG
ncbi:hypothetical protein KUCAC02_024445, partial [Chaenocephalus aceratus]